ncbi:hypothetical protein ACQKE8_13060 [Sphingobium limneticum]|uniref:hypothetical protein n=1 Tax=Sphingobium limneticum TaxID=1007511 RepID=UPI003D057BC5
MSIALSINGEPGVVSDLVDTTTDRQRRILRHGPTVYLIPERIFFEEDANGNLLRWHDAMGTGYFAPASAPLTVMDEGYDLRSLDFTKTNGQALRDVLNIDRIPAAGSPGTIVALVRAASDAPNFGGILGNRTAYGNKMVAFYVDASLGTPNLQMQFGNLDKALFSNAAINDNGFHLVIMSWKGSAAGTQVIQDGVAQAFQTNTLSVGTDPGARKLLIGDYGPIGTDPFRGQIAALAIIPAYVGQGENSDLLTDLLGEFGAYRITLNGGTPESGGYVPLLGMIDA